ncbi:MAG TPA: glycosyltransferase family 39 protein [Clostridia bacterium]|nr:glycosyltransferase family 39 protein [Clostridia bacterium]
MKLRNLKKSNFGLIVIMLLAAFLRLGGLSWGLPYHFHPDEWNMAAAIIRISWENRFNPGFFAYGQLPLYLTCLSAWLYNQIPWIKLSFVNLAEAIFFLRFWSALVGSGSVYLVFLIAQKLVKNKRFSLLAALLAAFTPGLIQISHFGTTESLLAFAFLGVVYFSLMILEKASFKNFFGASVFLGIALGTKISALIFFFPLALVSFFKFFKSKQARALLGGLSAFGLALGFGLLTSPYLIFDFIESKRIVFYETQVAIGQILVFYTRQFFKTTPILFQLQKIFPYALGWPIFILGLLGFLVIAFGLIKRLIKNKSLTSGHFPLLVVLSSFLVYFLSQSFLFCKWTRFMAPVFAFFPLFAVLFLSRFKKTPVFLGLLVTLALIPGLIFSSIYFRPDIRLTASEWIYQNIPSGAKVLSESGNVIDIPIADPNQPLNSNYSLSMASFDFYHLDDNPKLFSQLLKQLGEAEYLFIPSRRIFANHLRLPLEYPKTAQYYQLLFSGKLGFKLIKEISPLPAFFSDEKAEETWSVFDHPVIRIYQKSLQLTKEEYERLFKVSP